MGRVAGACGKGWEVANFGHALMRGRVGWLQAVGRLIKGGDHYKMQSMGSPGLALKSTIEMVQLPLLQQYDSWGQPFGQAPYSHCSSFQFHSSCTYLDIPLSACHFYGGFLRWPVAEVLGNPLPTFLVIAPGASDMGRHRNSQ